MPTAWSSWPATLALRANRRWAGTKLTKLTRNGQTADLTAATRAASRLLGDYSPQTPLRSLIVVTLTGSRHLGLVPVAGSNQVPESGKGALTRVGGKMLSHRHCVRDVEPGRSCPSGQVQALIAKMLARLSAKSSPSRSLTASRKFCRDPRYARWFG